MANESVPTQNEAGTLMTQAIGYAGDIAVSEPLGGAVQRYRILRASCEALMMSGSEMTPDSVRLDSEIRRALRAIAEIPAHTRKDIQEKLEVLKSAHRWSGPDGRLVPLAIQVAEEAAAFFPLDKLDHKQSEACATGRVSGRNLGATTTGLTAVR